MACTVGGLLRGNQDFRRFWVGDALSKVGSQVLLFAVPVLAATALDASTWEVSLLATFAGLPYLLFGLMIGVWSDRLRRRPVLITADVGRAAALAWIPVSSALGSLNVEQLYVVQFVVGTGTAVFDISQGAYLPFLAGRNRLVEANSALEANRTVTYTLGPSLAGQLVTWVGAATAVTSTVAGFLWSALWIGAIRVREPTIVRTSDRHLWREIGAGVRFTLGEPFIRATTLHGTCAVLFLSTRYAIETLFLLRTVGIDPAIIGLLMVGPGLGSVLGAAIASRVAQRVGRVRTVLLTGIVMGVASLLIPLTADGPQLTFYVAGAAIVSCAITMNNVTSVSLRQMLCPDDLLGRMNATSRFIAWATLPLGGILGGLLGTAIGLRGALWVSGVGMLVSVLWLALAPIIRTRDLVTS